MANCRVGGARKPHGHGALREPVGNCGKRFQGFESVRNPPFFQRFASRTLPLERDHGQT